MRSFWGLHFRCEAARDESTAHAQWQCLQHLSPCQLLTTADLGSSVRLSSERDRVFFGARLSRRLTMASRSRPPPAEDDGGEDDGEEGEPEGDQEEEELEVRRRPKRQTAPTPSAARRVCLITQR